MQARDLEFDPMDYYDKYLKNQIKENAAAYFDDLVNKTNTDVGKNAITANEIRKWEAKDAENEKSLSRFKGLNLFVIVVAVICFIVFIIALLALLNSDESSVVPLVLTILMPILGVILIVISCTVLKKKIKELLEIDAQNDAKLSKLYKEAREELARLYDAFDSSDFDKIVKKTTDIFSLDPVLKPEKLLMLRELYGFKDEPTLKESIIRVSSGDIATNPYIRLRLYSQSMGAHTYVGTLPITWTEYVSDKDGGHLVTHHETLTATVVEPEPLYSTGSYIIYGNEAAPDLSFSRQPSKVDPYMSEKEMNKFEDKTAKKLAKLAEDSIKKGGTFTPLANSKFEGLFGAYDRDNEVQFRLLFTPLAQENMCELIMRKEPYGDDFSFFKRKKINIVSSLHGSAVTPYDENAYSAYYDAKEMKQAFVNSIVSNFNSLFFEMAPILCIPLYQQTDAGKFDVVEHYQHVSTYDAEAFANSMNPELFKPEAATTPQILKVNFLNSVGDTDFFQVSSSAFEAVPQLTFVPVMGGDGHMHDVPVHWFRYDPVSKMSTIGVHQFIGNKFQFRNLANDQSMKNASHIFTQSTKNQNMLGFYLETGYNYSQEEEKQFSSLINKYLDINRKVE